MQHEEVIPDVANERVDIVKREFESEGAKVKVKRNADGKTSTVIAEFAD
jgi:hypothetical protein